MVTKIKCIYISDRDITIICIGVIELSLLSLISGYLVIGMIELSFHIFNSIFIYLLLSGKSFFSLKLENESKPTIHEEIRQFQMAHFSP